MKTYTYSEARQNLSALLDEAGRGGEIRIRRRDGRTFVVRLAKRRRSPLDVDGIDLDLSAPEIVSTVRAIRRRPPDRQGSSQARRRR